MDKIKLNYKIKNVKRFLNDDKEKIKIFRKVFII